MTDQELLARVRAEQGEKRRADACVVLLTKHGACTVIGPFADPTAANEFVASYIAAHGTKKRTHRPGTRTDVYRLTAPMRQEDHP